MEVLLYSLLVIILVIMGFVIALFPIIKPSNKHGFIENLKRALITGLGFLIFLISTTAAFEYLSSPTTEITWNLHTLESLSCFALPVTLITILGSFIWYSGRDSIREPDKID